jgi:hypothetical protein
VQRCLNERALPNTNPRNEGNARMPEKKKKKFPYYKRIRTREGLIVEKVANKKDEKRLKEHFPESFENNN